MTAREERSAAWVRFARRLGITASNGTAYIDIPVPFLNVVLICDVGRNRDFGWRRKR